MTTPHNLSVFDHVFAPAPRYMMRLALIGRMLREMPASAERFLEIGPGMGDLSLHLADRFPDAEGDLMDVSSHSQSVITPRIAGRPRLHALHDDFRRLNRPAQYDLIVACEVFEHIDDDESAFAAVQALLKPGGHFIFSVPAFWSHWQASDQFAGHFRRYERAEIGEKFGRHGLHIDKLWCYGFPVTTLLTPVTRRYYGHRLSRQRLSTAAATEQSGVDRDLARKLPRRLMVALLYPMFLLQYLVKNRDIGDGFLVLARKR